MATGPVSASQIIDKTLFAAKKVKVYRRPDANSDVLGIVMPGDRVGKVYSWTTQGGDVWWALYEKYGASYGAHVKHEPDAFSFKSLKQQGAQTVEEQKKEEEEKDKSGFDKFLDRAGETLKKAAPWVVGFLLAREAIRTRNK